MTSPELIAAWESAYRRYGEIRSEDLASSSREVARAWRSLAEGTSLPWWLTAAVYTAAEAFERQAEDLAVPRAIADGESQPEPRDMVPAG